MTARSICPDLIPESEEVAAMFEQALKLFARCHHIYDSCRVLKDREIDRLGEWNMNKLKATFYTYSFHNLRFIHQGVYVLLPDTLSSCHRNSKDAHAGRAHCVILTKMACRILLHGGSRVLDPFTILSTSWKSTYMNTPNRVKRVEAIVCQYHLALCPPSVVKKLPPKIRITLK